MKLSKMIYALTSELKVRPLIVAAMIFLLCDLIYVNHFASYRTLSQKEGESCVIQGIVRDKGYDDSGNLKTVTIGNCLCYVNKVGLSSEPAIGCTVKLTGDLYTYKPPMNYGSFNPQKYYASKKIYHYMYTQTLAVQKWPRINIFESSLLLRKKLSASVLSFAPLEAGTVNTLLFSDKSNLNEDRKLLYQASGVAHFLVISGLHVSAIGSAVYFLLKRTGIKRKHACEISILMLVAYGLLVGFSISVTRAVIMFTVRLFADIIKEVYDMLSAVCFSLCITILINPLWILDSAFAYSYGTVISIALYVSYIQPKKIRKIGLSGHIREALRIPVVLAFAILPITLRVSYRYSLLSIPVNAVLAPFSGPILLFAFLCFVFSGLKIKVLAGFFDFLLAVLLRGLDKICSLAITLPAFNIMGKPSIQRILIYYLLLALYAFILRNLISRHLSITFLLSLCCLLYVPILHVPKISMLYVGQGECIVLNTSPRKAIIIDCGSSTEKDICKNILFPYLEASGINCIEAVIASHSDMDHIGEFINLINNAKLYGIRLNRLCMPDLKEMYQDDLYKETVRSAKKNSLDTYYLKMGMHVNIDGAYMHVLWPSIEKESGDSNADSLVMTCAVNNKIILFTGDATSETEKRIMGDAGDIDILKVSHHGSKTASSKELLSSVKPELALISAGINNRYGHPSHEVLQRLADINVPYLCTTLGEIDIPLK